MLRKLTAISALALIVLSACSAAPTQEVRVSDVEPTAVVEEAMEDTEMEDTMEESEMTEDEKAADDAMMEDDEMAEDSHDDSMAEDGEMMEDDDKSEDAMMEDDAMADDSHDDSMAEDGEMMEDGDKADEAMMEDDAMMAEGNLKLNFNGLEDLGEDYVYEGWLIVDGSPVTAGRFSVDADGNYPEYFALDQADVDAASAYILTIEPAEGDDPAPSDVHIVAGDFDAGSAALDISHPAALGTDFADADGSSFILAVPTADGEAPYQNGIWFTGLNLPELPAGWVYEGWVVGPDGPVTTGTFRNNDEADSDGAGAAAGPNDAPAVPGADFLDPAKDLLGYTAVISVEPDPDNSPAPFTLKPLVGEITDAGAEVDQPLGLNPDSFPTGTADKISADAMMMEDGDKADEAMMEDDAMMAEGNLTLDFAGLEDLGPDYVYEGWLIVNGNAITAGRFSVDADGKYPTSFALDQADVDAASAYVLTIEPAEGDDPAPSAVHIIAGDFDGSDAALSIDHPAALNTDFAAADSTFILAVPTADGEAPYQNGIWFTGLNLPELPNGWVYEGWVVGPDGPVTTGTFRNNDEADSDGAGAAAGPNDAPAVPGADFLDPATDLLGYTAVISVEPDPDNSPAPFTLKPLVGEITEAGAEVDQPLGVNADSFPTGTASR